MSTGTAEQPSSYDIEIKASARKQIAALARKDQEAIAATIESLATAPRGPGREKLKGEPNAYRIRAGDYRIVYEIHDDVLIVMVVRVGHRRDVYRKLKKRKR
jgi:mRNA interferase RelE/StbE